MGNKSILLVCILVSATAMLMGASPVQGQLSPPVLGLPREIIIVSGRVLCTPTGNVGVNATLNLPPVFANATVQLRGNGTVIQTQITTNLGGFLFLLVNRNNIILPQILNGNITVVVTTPLSICNSTLPSVGLQSPLVVTGNISFLGILNIIAAVTVGFRPFVLN